MAFIHNKNCKGGLILDLTSMVRIMSPSVTIHDGKVGIGIADIVRVKNEGNSVPNWYCGKCGTSISHQEMLDSSLCKCSICGEEKPLKDILSISGMFGVCSDCVQLKSDLESGKVPLEGIKDYILIRLDVLPDLVPDLETMYNLISKVSVEY